MELSERQIQSPAIPKPLGEIGRAGAAARDAISPAENGSWASTLQWAVAAAITILLMWLTYTRGGWVPFLSGADLAIHEFGHMLTMWAPPLLCSLAGSFLQVAAPLGLAAYFWWRRDSFAVIVLVAWAAESLNNVSVYVGDAQRMVLPLFGDDGSGAGHDWHNILRDTGLLGSTDAIARSVQAASVCLFVVALGLAVLGFVHARRSGDGAPDTQRHAASRPPGSPS
jgi:hypothetical protein